MAPSAEPPKRERVAEYRIEDLAREAGTTVRNVRAYRDRGLLPAPRREGRLALYSEAHVGRLRLIAALLERGYTLGNIAELLHAWEDGQDIADLLGLEDALAGRWSDEIPTTITIDELTSLFGAEITPEILRQVADLGTLETDPANGGRLRVNSPRLLEAGAELRAAGVPLDVVLELGKALQEDVDRIALNFVRTVNTYVVDPLGKVPPPAEVPQLAEVIRRLRPLAQKSVVAELARAMDRRIEAELGERIGRMLSQVTDAESTGS